MRFTSTIAAAMFAGAMGHAAAAPEVHRVPDTIAQRVQACTPCHGKEGVATRTGYLPRIAGKPAGYLVNQLLNFRDGRRNNAAMGRLVENLSDAYLHEIADYFASLDLPYAPNPALSAPAAELERGAQLVARGDVAIGVPACGRCHGAAMTGVAPATPGLLGLPKDYLIAQLGAWRTGLRGAQAPDCMREISRRLSALDVSAVASYLSRQPLPRDPKPAATNPGPLPLDCGSATR